MPSMQPSQQPSRSPSSQPSSSPSAQPSCQPTIQPTYQPSSEPTTQPTSQPTGQPSPVPSTSYPTCQPSALPSSQPTKQPTDSPSAQPSSKPSGTPSRQPISKPSSQPSTQPSSVPTSQPTLTIETYWENKMTTQMDEIISDNSTTKLIFSRMRIRGNDLSGSCDDWLLFATQTMRLELTKNILTSIVWYHFDDYTPDVAPREYRCSLSSATTSIYDAISPSNPNDASVQDIECRFVMLLICIYFSLRIG